MTLDFIQKNFSKIGAFVRKSRFLAFGKTRRDGVFYALLVAVFVLLAVVIKLSAYRVLDDHNAHAAVNLSSGPIIRTYEIGKTYKVQLLRSISTNPDNIEGVAARDIHILFGNSSFIRQEGNIAIWQYANGSCVLDIFFESRQGRPEDFAPAAYYEIRPASQTKEPLDRVACVRDLLNGNAGPYMVNVGAFYKSVIE